MPCTGVWNAKEKTWAEVQKNSWLLSLVLLTYQRQGSCLKRTGNNCWQCTLHSCHWTDATEQAGPRNRSCCFFSQPICLHTVKSQLPKHDSGLNIHIFPHSMKSNTSKNLTWYSVEEMMVTSVLQIKLSTWFYYIIHVHILYIFIHFWELCFFFLFF